MVEQKEKGRTYRRMVNSMNKAVIGLQRVGIVIGPMRLITVTGRRSGLPRTFPIAVLPLTGGQYIFQAYPRAAWVANVRAADTATLTRGRHSSTVRLIELPVEERRPVLHELVRTSNASVGKRFVTTGLAEGATPDEVAAAAERIAVFRIEPLR
ncbi:nitroreductase/quinone reductase family protein [Amycolatopsis taiwanensis]|uniref:nitroreductase/quinone reductase family protein n=1 Tax=Amycolatopsis taiwanensis TaxID=342230 RepID=UPI0004B62ED6|nr:nitroreductase/quinone reductase family protein [Amycolatopsis taiwanensis]